MEHATVKIGNYTIPLIGVPKEAGEDKCDRCGKRFQIQSLELIDGKIICRDCRQSKAKRS